jgi:hypothetical protein
MSCEPQELPDYQAGWTRWELQAGPWVLPGHRTRRRVLARERLPDLETVSAASGLQFAHFETYTRFPWAALLRSDRFAWYRFILCPCAPEGSKCWGNSRTSILAQHFSPFGLGIPYSRKRYAGESVFIRTLLAPEVLLQRVQFGDCTIGNVTPLALQEAPLSRPRWKWTS